MGLSRGHSSIAYFWDAQEASPEEIIQKGEAVFASGMVRRRCLICKKRFHVEHSKTKYRTLEEANLEIDEMQVRNQVVRELIRDAQASKN